MRQRSGTLRFPSDSETAPTTGGYCAMAPGAGKVGRWKAGRSPCPGKATVGHSPKSLAQKLLCILPVRLQRCGQVT